MYITFCNVKNTKLKFYLIKIKNKIVEMFITFICYV